MGACFLALEGPVGARLLAMVAGDEHCPAAANGRIWL